MKTVGHVIIVFISNYEQYAVKGYEAGAWRYLLKPVKWEAFSRGDDAPFFEMSE